MTATPATINAIWATPVHAHGDDGGTADTSPVVVAFDEAAAEVLPLDARAAIVAAGETVH